MPGVGRSEELDVGDMRSRGSREGQGRDKGGTATPAHLQMGFEWQRQTRGPSRVCGVWGAWGCPQGDTHGPEQGVLAPQPCRHGPTLSPRLPLSSVCVIGSSASWHGRRGSLLLEVSTPRGISDSPCGPDTPHGAGTL